MHEFSTDTNMISLQKLTWIHKCGFHDNKVGLAQAEFYCRSASEVSVDFGDLCSFVVLHCASSLNLQYVSSHVEHSMLH